MIYRKEITERNAVFRVAELMAMAARTAPKAKGIDNLEIIILEGKEKDQLANKMRQIAEEHEAAFFNRDATNIDESQLVFLAGTQLKPVGVAVCGYCGYTHCAENMENEGICAFNAGDLGVAIGSAAAIATDHRCDNRIMFTAGKAAMLLGYFESDVKNAYGIPLSVSGKSPFFDRK